MRYTITVIHEQKRYRYTVEHVAVNQRIEYFKLIARNKTLTIECNRPFFRSRGLKHRRYELKIIEGSTVIWNMAFLQEIYEQIEKLAEMYLEN